MKPRLELGLDELLDEYMHCKSELLSKICHTSDMSRVSEEDLYLYAVVCGLNCRRVKDSTGHWSAQ